MSTEVAATEAAYFQRFSFSLIAASSARFILICDGIDQGNLFEQFPGLSPPIEIFLRSYKVTLRLEANGKQIQRVLVVIPDRQRLMRGGGAVWRSAQNFAQIVRLATILTKIEGIDYKFFENSRSHASVFPVVVEKSLETH
jgi:hypothetical protein